MLYFLLVKLPGQVALHRQIAGSQVGVGIFTQAVGNRIDLGINNS